jgi:tetratricopeptide (TPR) repeat protein
MNTRLSILLSGITIIVLFLFVINISNNELETTPKLVTSYIKCTPAKFLLEEIDSTKQISPLFENLGNLTYEISTNSVKAQQFFNQGLRLTYAFNHAEAHRSFLEASRLDPTAAMSFWGQAYALGPNINDPLPDDERKKNYNKAIKEAINSLNTATQKERDLIEALSHRYSTDLSKDVAELNVTYMKAMEKVVKKYPDDANIQTLYAAAVMNTTPWNYWDKEGNPQPNIAEAKAALEKAIEIDPDNPGAHHYYIHMVELPKPDLGVPSADRLGELMPSAGHLVHMPSHIYIRVGRYKDAVEANQKAILADEDYISQCYAQGMYPLGYYPHNIHFLWSAASLLGASDIAIDAAKKTAEKVPVGEMKEMHFLQNFAATPLLAYTRFGKWNDILTYPKPNDDITHLKLIWHYSRGIAFIKKDNLKEAKEELDAIQKYISDPDMETNMATGFDPGTMIAKLAYEIVSGEYAFANNKVDMAIEHLKRAVEIEDNLTYNEPSAWHIPPRQNLGHILMKAEKYEAAEQIYREDLRVLRQNGWSLIGLHNALKAQNKIDEANTIKTEFEKAWKDADIKVTASIK